MKKDDKLIEKIERRNKLFRVTRDFFYARNFIEVDTPALYGYRDMTLHLNDFTTELKTDNTKRLLSLMTSPEYYMKMLVAGGASRIFQLSHFFRNGEITERHSPEFMGLEFYITGCDYHEIMRVTSEYLKSVFEAFGKGEVLEYQGNSVELNGDWEKVTVSEAVKRKTGVDIHKKITIDELRGELKARGYLYQEDDSYDDLFFRVYLADVEPELGMKRPVWLYEYPEPMSAFARLKPGDSTVAERCELYIAGVELANGYTELNDSKEQRARLSRDGIEKEKRTGERFSLDERFISAVGEMPLTGGIAIGIERLLMLLADTSKITDVQPCRI